jgi:hypothetical protein
LRGAKSEGKRLGRPPISAETEEAIGVDQGGNKYLLDGVCHRMKLSDRWDYIKQLKRKWEGHPGVQMVKVGYERYCPFPPWATARSSAM